MSGELLKLRSQPGRPLAIAHRGASAACRENTVEAFRLAAELKADMVELDVRRTADGVLVTHHDVQLPDGRPIHAVAAADLPGDVPTLAAALEACEPAAVNVEIKLLPHEPDFDPSYDVADAVASVIRSGGADDRVIVSSFDPAMVARVRRLGLPTAQLVFGGFDAAVIAAAGHDAVNPHHGSLSEGLVTAAHDAGLAVYPWTVDDPARMRQLLRWGVDGLISNVPDLARREILRFAT